jgi:hypothetical protein
MLCSAGDFWVKITPGEAALRSERKKIYFFFLSSFPERMFREVTGESPVSSTLRGIWGDNISW